MEASARLVDVAILTYAVDAGRLARLLPPGVVPDGADDGHRAWASAVAFRARGLRVRGVPALRADCGHVDYRAYVRVGSEHGVWFLGAAMDHWLARTVRIAWRMPWHRASVQVDGSRPPGAYEAAVRNGHGDLDLTARAAVDAGRPVDGFTDVAGFVDRIVNPTAGYFVGRRGRVRRYTVAHERVQPVPMAVESARVGLFEALGLVAPAARPDAAHLLPDFDIAIHLPPKLLRRP
jgi:uncharacterized protein YqjF (DUF2071 family)